MTPQVLIVILNYNGFKDTKACLESLLKTNYTNFSILVMDNGSTQDETIKLRRLFNLKRINFLRLDRNLGFTGSNNLILQKTKEKYVVLLNNDTVVEADWLKYLVKAVERDKTIAIVQPKILWFWNKKYFDYAGACGGFIDFFGYPFTRGRVFNTIEKDHGQYDTPSTICWASGAAIILRTSVLKKVGLFDTRFFNYMEEIDLCFRIYKAGYNIVFEPKSVVYHKVASTASRNMFKKRFWEHRNNLLLILKNYPSMHLFYVLPIRILLEFISIIYYLYIKKANFASAVILAQFSFLLLFPIVVIERITNKTPVKRSITAIIYKGSIIFNYFILKKRNYLQITSHTSDIHRALTEAD